MITGYIFTRRDAPEAVLSNVGGNGNRHIRDLRLAPITPEEAARLSEVDLSLEPIQNGANRVYHLNPTCSNTAAPDGVAIACVVDPEKGAAYYETREGFEDKKGRPWSDDQAPSRRSTPVRPCVVCSSYRPPTDPNDRAWRAAGLCLDDPEPGDWFSADPDRIARARSVCRVCPSRVECSEYGRDANQEFGVWGEEIPTDRGQIANEYRRNLRMIREEYQELRLDLEGVQS